VSKKAVKEKVPLTGSLVVSHAVDWIGCSLNHWPFDVDRKLPTTVTGEDLVKLLNLRNVMLFRKEDGSVCLAIDTRLFTQR